MSAESPPRLSVAITEEQKVALTKYVPWGHGKAMWHAIIDDIIAQVQIHGPVFVLVLGARKVQPHEIMPSLAKAKEDSDKLKEE